MAGLLDMNRLFFKQKAKLVELTSEYAIHDQDGVQVGVIRQEGQTKLKKLARAVSSLDQFMTHTLAAYDAGGTKILEITRPRALLRSKVHVKDGSGNEVGTIAQKNIIGKIRFRYEDPNGALIGALGAENWRAWNFTMTDADGIQVGTITKKWAGVGRELFTTADTYLFEIDQTVTGPLRLLCLASAVGIDLVLKQGE